MSVTKLNCPAKFFTLISKYYFLIISTAYLLRVLPLFIHPTLWAEDATVFYGPLLKHQISFHELLFSTYAGQRFTLQFIIAKVLLTILGSKLLYLPILSTLVCIALTYAMGLIWLRSDFLVKSRTGRRAIFGYILLAPSAWEGLGNLTNLHGYLLLGLFGLAGWNMSKDKFGIPIFLLVSGFSVMTSINGLFLLGVIAVSAHFNKKNFWIPFIGVAALVAFQAIGWLIRTGGLAPESIKTQIANSSIASIKRIGAGMIVGQNGESYVAQFMNNQRWLFIGSIPIFFLCILIKKAKSRESSLVPFFFILTALILYFILVLCVSRPIGISHLTEFGSAGRYFVIVHTLVFVLFVLAVENLPNEKTLVTKITTVALIFMILLGVASDFRLKDKSNSMTRSSWLAFSRCYEASGKNCRALVPPGQSWGNWGISLN